MAETFQPESENENVRVVGMLEAMGQNFDAVWLCRMNEGIWPASGQPNPFIPHPLQREKQMPHASVQREVEFGHLALQRLLQSAPEVIISFSQQEGDIPLQSSPLLAPWLSSVQNEVSRPNPWGQRIVEQMQQDHFQDWQGLPFDGEQLRGGTSLFQNQVQCPFKAYVLNRLRANTPEEAQPAVAADQHGRLLHHALALFWGDIQSQTNLLALSDQGLREKINASVDAASSQLGHALINASKIFVEVEKKRIAKHMAEWLENEKNRPPFQVVSIEHKREVTFADKKFNMIVDRVDRLENDAHLCIDYKTGKSMKGGDLVKDPLEQAQLPLYALTFEPTPQAVAYGILNVEVNGLSGVGAKETASNAGFSNGTPKGMQENWDEQMTVWREQLTETLEKYLKGEAQRAPLSSKVCTYCAARPVCRKDETIALTPKGDHHG